MKVQYLIPYKNLFLINHFDNKKIFDQVLLKCQENLF